MMGSILSPSLSQIRELLMPVLSDLPSWTGFTLLVGPLGLTVRIYFETADVPNLPREIGGLPIEVRRMPWFTVVPPAEAASAPPVAGASAAAIVGPAAVAAVPAAAFELKPLTDVFTKAHDGPLSIKGGFGLITGFLQQAGKTWLISANHVVADNGRLTNFGNGDGVQAGGVMQTVSTDVKFRPIVQPGENPVDAAICLLKDGLATEPPPLYPVEWHLTNGIPERPSDEDVLRFRKRTGVEVTGRVVHHSFDAHLKTQLSGDVDHPVMTDHIVMALDDGGTIEPGDSGSLVVATSNGETRPAGILIGSSDDVSVKNALITPLDSVMLEFNQATGGADRLLV
jgi:hypothetical protein